VTIDAKKMDDIPRALSEVVDYLNNMDIIKSKISRSKEIALKQIEELADLIKTSPDLLSTSDKLFKAGKTFHDGFQSNRY